MDTDNNKEEGDDYRKAVKCVIVKQLKELLQQLEKSGQQVSVMTVDPVNNTCTHFGTAHAKSFISEQPQMMSHFLDFCKSKSDSTETPDLTTASTSLSSDTEVVDDETPVTKAIDKKKLLLKAKPAKPVANPTDVVSDVLQVEIPKTCTSSFSENEVASLVGRLVAAQLITTKQRGDKAGSTMKFKMLLGVANKTLRREKKITDIETSPVKPPSTPGSTRSGRRVSSKFLESINSLKKHSKVKSEMTGNENEERDNIMEEKDFLQEISAIDSSILKRVHIKSGDGKLVDATLTELISSPELETLAVQLIQELHVLTKKQHPIFNHKFIKVMIISDESTEAMRAQIVKSDWSGIKKKEEMKAGESQEEDEPVDLVEMGEEEETELREDLGEFIKDIDSASDPEFTPDGKHKKGPRKQAVKIGRVATNSPTPKGLIRNPKKRHYTETMPVDCQHCGITLTGRSNLKSHIKRIHMNIRNHACLICRKGFWSSNALESHMLSVHTRQCEACQEYVVESVPWSKDLTMKTRRDVICTCGGIVSIYSTFGRKRIYLRDDEPDEEGNIYVKRPKNNPGTKYACGTCGKLFMKKSNCERHSRRHSDIKNCVCDICGSAYMYESSLKKHMATEHGITNHVCDLCGGNYATLTALKVHIVRAHRNVNIGEDVAIVLKEQVKDEGEEPDEEEEEEEMEMNVMEIEGHADDDHPEIIVNGTSGEIIVHHKGTGQELVEKFQSVGPDTQGEESVVVSRTTIVEEQPTEQIVLTQADDMAGTEEHIVLNQGRHIVVTSDGTDQTAQLVQQVIDGQVVSQDGEMSIIIKQIPIENEIY